MSRPKHYTPDGARMFAQSLANLHAELAKQFGFDFANQFLITFYHGAGSDE